MKKTMLNGKRYIALGDFDALRHNLVRDIYDKYERDENGQYHLSDLDAGQIHAYSHIMTAIMDEEIHAAESPDEIRAMHDVIRREYLRDKYVIVGRDDEGDVYFRKMCCCGEDGEEVPAFTGVKRLAKTFDDHYIATLWAKGLSDRTGHELKVKPLDIVMMSAEEAQRLLDAIFDGAGEDPGEYHGDGTKAEDEDWEGEE